MGEREFKIGRKLVSVPTAPAGGGTTSQGGQGGLMRVVRIIAAAAILFVVLSVFLGSWYTINETERGVVLRNGALVGTAEPGLHFKIPLIEDVVRIDVTQRAVTWTGEYHLEAYSQDQQPANISMSVIYHVPPTEVENVYRQYTGVDGLEERLIARIVPQELKIVFGRYTAASAIQNRAKFTGDVETQVKEGVQGPVVIDQVNIEDVSFSEAYENSIEQRMLAEIEVTKIRQNAEREKVQAEITVTQANAQADSQLATATAAARATEIQAKADAEHIRLRGEAEAAAIRARVQALGSAPDAIIALTQAEKWNGVLPTTMVPGSTVPFLGVR